MYQSNTSETMNFNRNDPAGAATAPYASRRWVRRDEQERLPRAMIEAILGDPNRRNPRYPITLIRLIETKQLAAKPPNIERTERQNESAMHKDGC
jgi:hypothetical protein